MFNNLIWVVFTINIGNNTVSGFHLYGVGFSLKKMF